VLDRWVNIFFSLALVFVFILLGDIQDHNQILIGIFIAILFSTIAFVLNWLTIDGTISAIIFGSFAYGLGGLPGAAVILGFFISGSFLSKDLISKEGFLEKKFRRNAKQVWSNGFWFALWILIWFLSGGNAFLFAGVSAIAAAASDTWATEVGGHRFKRKTWLITTGKKVESGTDGGISVYGTIAAFSGALFISLVFYIFGGEANFLTFIIITVSGFLGCLIDSYIGARFQNGNQKVPLTSLVGVENMYVSNNFVNWISAGFASVISLALTLIFGV
jgi:uncharacterized protein (TIGR00297 family)